MPQDLIVVEQLPSDNGGEWFQIVLIEDTREHTTEPMREQQV